MQQLQFHQEKYLSKPKSQVILQPLHDDPKGMPSSRETKKPGHQKLQQSCSKVSLMLHNIMPRLKRRTGAHTQAKCTARGEDEI